VVIEPNEFLFVNAIIESGDALFDETCFSPIPRPRDVVSHVPEMEHHDSQIQDQQDVDYDNILELRRSKGQDKLETIGRIFLSILLNNLEIQSIIVFCIVLIQNRIH